MQPLHSGLFFRVSLAKGDSKVSKGGAKGDGFSCVNPISFLWMTQKNRPPVPSPCAKNLKNP